MQRRFYFAVIVVVASSFFIGSFTNAQKSPEAEERLQLKELMIQRRDVLQRLVNELDKNGFSGHHDLDAIVKARRLLLEAELELATTKDKRLELLHKQIENLRKLEDIQEIRSGKTITIDALLQARAMRLKAEIEFVRERDQP